MAADRRRGNRRQVAAPSSRGLRRAPARPTTWFTDAYFLSPGTKSLLTLFGAEHSLGGISGYTSTETTDESPDRVALIQRLTWAYLRSMLYPTDTSWSAASAELTESTDPLGSIESK